MDNYKLMNTIDHLVALDKYQIELIRGILDKISELERDIGSRKIGCGNTIIYADSEGRPELLSRRVNLNDCAPSFLA